MMQLAIIQPYSLSDALSSCFRLSAFCTESMKRQLKATKVPKPKQDHRHE